jgi:hypothetical protein
MGVCFDSKTKVACFLVEETLRVLICLQIMMQQMNRRNQSKELDLFYFEVIKKTCPIPNLNTAISPTETNQCQICAALERGANVEKRKVF